MAVRVLGELLKADLKVANARFEKGAAAAYRKVARVALRTLIDKAPVDTGQLVSNYRVGLGRSTPRGMIEPYSPGHKGSTAAANRGAAYAAASARLMAAQPKDTINIVNTARHFPYNKDTPAHVDQAIAAAAATLADAKVFA